VVSRRDCVRLDGTLVGVVWAASTPPDNSCTAASNTCAATVPAACPPPAGPT